MLKQVTVTNVTDVVFLAVSPSVHEKQASEVTEKVDVSECCPITFNIVCAPSKQVEVQGVSS